MKCATIKLAMTEAKIISKKARFEKEYSPDILLGETADEIMH